MVSIEHQRVSECLHCHELRTLSFVHVLPTHFLTHTIATKVVHSTQVRSHKLQVVAVVVRGFWRGRHITFLRNLATSGPPVGRPSFTAHVDVSYYWIAERVLLSSIHIMSKSKV